MKNLSSCASFLALFLFQLMASEITVPAVQAQPSATKETVTTDEQIYDPWEPLNRKTFWLNERLDKNILGPVAHGYDYITTDSMQRGVTNFFENLKFPTFFAADIFQAKFGQALNGTGRFLINSTVGVLGLMDVATDMGLKQKEEDFALVFSSWGIPSGPYFVVPFIGPSTVRDTVGLVFDVFTSPSFLITRTNASDSFKFWWPLGSSVVKYVNLRNNYDDAIRAGREGSMDYYTFQQSSYYQYRAGLENDSANSPDPKHLGDKKHDGHEGVDADLDAMLKQSKHR